jgi:polygalacturonase
MSIGGQTPGGLRNLIVRNCTFDGTEAGIRFKAGRGNGGIVENVTCEDLKMKNVKVAIFVSSFYPTNVKDPTTMPTTQSAEKIPVWRNCTFSNITAEGGETAGHLFGLPEAYVENFTFKNVTISASKPFDIAYAKGIKFVDSSVKLKSNAPAVIFKQAEISGIDASAWK